MTSFVIKRSATDYVINCDAQGNGGYNVVPKEVDKWNKYTIEDVEAYLSEHPEALLDFDSIEAEKAKIAEISKLKSYLTSTDYIYPKCLELALDVDVVYADVVAQRKLARNRIQELETST